MKIQLLLLLVALAGPIGAFPVTSYAPEHLDDNEGATTLGHPATKEEEPTAVTTPYLGLSTLPEPVTTMALPTEYAFVNPTSMPEQAETEMFVAVHTSEPAHLASEPPAVETAAPAATTKEAEAKVTAALEIDQRPKDEVVIEEGADGSSEGRSSGQVAGIVIGALLVVIIVIAVVIAAVRRMGKYSP